MSGMLYFLRNRCVAEEEKQKRVALIFATWFSILAPLSWFIIFKSHSYLHVHMNFIVWQMPFVFFGFAVCGLVVKSLLPARQTSI
jgi:ABC-type multidrug transport system permease subunit